LREQVAGLVEKVAVLEKVLKGDSSNSSRSPSSDSDTAKNKRVIPNARKLRKGAKRPKGKQPGAPGSTLRAIPNPDDTLTYRPPRCRGCGGGLGGAVVVGVVARQVFDIPVPKVVVVEHRAERRRCGCGCETTAEFPAEATAPACYGPKVKAYAIYLMVRQHIPQERCAEALAELFGLDVSVGTLNNWLSEAARALGGFLAAVAAALGRARVMHADETSVRHAKGKVWFHVYSTVLLTLLRAHPTRGNKAILAGPLMGYRGIAVHDRYSAYFGYVCGHALCNAHVIRNLASVATTGSQKRWAEAFIALLIKAKDQVEAAKQDGMTGLTGEQLGQIRQQWDRLCVQASTANPDPARGRERTNQQKESYNLALAMRQHRDLFLKFTTAFDVPFDNNQAERDLRMVKIQAKISGEFRSLHGAQRFADIRSYISTTIKHGLHTLDNLTRLYTPEGAWLPPIAPEG
jgi:transposase